MGNYDTVQVDITTIPTMLKQKKRLQHNVMRALLLAVALLFSVTVAVPAVVRADSYQTQIDSLNAQSSQTQGNLQSLQIQASDYRDAINQLQAQISGIQSAIAANVAKQADLQVQIETAQARLDNQRSALGSDLKAMYISGQMSTVEMLATSKSLSDYVNAETYSAAIQTKIQRTLADITALQAQLKDQKAQIGQLLLSQQQQRVSLNVAEGQQQQLLSFNQNQQSNYNNQLKANSAKVAELRAEQAAANARLLGSGSVSVVASGTCGGEYPGDAVNAYGHWGCGYGLDNGTDNWGMYNRECVSYTAWRVYKAYGASAMPYWGGVGNANQWPGDARAYGIPTGAMPKVGSVAIGTNPYWFGSVGHAMWVEAVSGNKILVSQMNFGGPGRYSEMWLDSSLINTFIYFGN
jgi:surface antigen/peptidoglycan hydrolase CwlO-like protein